MVKAAVLEIVTPVVTGSPHFSWPAVGELKFIWMYQFELFSTLNLIFILFLVIQCKVVNQ